MANSTEYLLRVYEGCHTNSRSSGFAHIHADVVVWQPGQRGYRTQNPTDIPEKPHLFYYEMLIKSQIDGDEPRHEGDRRCYGWDLTHQLDVTIENVGYVHKTLTRYKRNLEKITAQLGQPQTFGVFCAMTAQALGIKTIIYRADIRDYDRAYQTYTTGEAIPMIDNLVKQLHERCKQHYGYRAA